MKNQVGLQGWSYIGTIGVLLLISVSTVRAMDTVGQEDQIERDILEGNQQVWALALSEKTDMPFDAALSVLHFYEQYKSSDENQAFLRLIGSKSRHENSELLRALIVAQSDHTQMLAQQIAQTKELAERSSVSTQKALSVAKQRLYVALAAVGLTVVSVTMNVLQAVDVFE